MSPVSKSTLELVELDPADVVLPLDGNVRKDTKLDPDFLASIKTRGVLVPILVIRNDAGGYEALDGQRRTLAAVEAKQKTIPAIVTTARVPADRVVDQLVVNDHRAELSDVEHVAAFEQLALFGLKPGDIVKRTTTPAVRVDAALKVAADPIASSALQKYNINLLQAAAIAEFSGNKASVKKLTEYAETRPDQFDHAVAAERAKAELEAKKDQLRSELDALNITRLTDRQDYQAADDGYSWIDKLAKADTPTVPITFDDIRELEDAAAALFTGYMIIDGRYQDGAKIRYAVRNPQDHDFVALEREIRFQEPPTPEQLAAQEANRVAAEARAKAENDWKLATNVRRAWISEYLERPNPPHDAINYIAWIQTYENSREDVSDLVIQWLDIAIGDADEANDEAARTALAARPKLAMTFALATAIATAEDWAPHAPQQWNPDFADELVTFPLNQLRAWGYGLSDAELAYIINVENKKLEPTDDTDDDE